MHEPSPPNLLDRRRAIVSLGSLALAALLPSESALAASDSPEPVYDVRLPGDITLKATVSTTRRPDGALAVRVFTSGTPAGTVPGFLLDTSIVREPGKGVPYARVSIGLTADTLAELEAIRSDEGNSYRLRTPAKDGRLLYGATLFGPLVAELFVGRLYDWKRSGEQTFAMFVDEGIPGAAMVTLKLKAEPGEETLDLPDGPVKARKLRYSAPLPNLPKDQQSGVVYVGPMGEMLRCETAFFGIPLKAKGAATLEGGGSRFVLRFGDNTPGGVIIALRADRVAAGWNITLEIEGGTAIASAACDKNYRMTRLETPWHTGKFTASTSGQEVRYHIEPGQPNSIPSPSGRAFFTADWFVTETWEGPGGAFADLAPGDSRDCDYLALLLASSPAQAFTLSRLPDLAAPVQSGTSTPVHHYGLAPKGGDAPQTELGKPVTGLQPSYDIYTDGRRLLAAFGGGARVIRIGWEKWASALASPARA